MNNIYKQKAEKYKYKYLKLKQKYIAEGGEFSEEEKELQEKVNKIIKEEIKPLLIKVDKRNKSISEMKSNSELKNIIIPQKLIEKLDESNEYQREMLEEINVILDKHKKINNKQDLLDLFKTLNSLEFQGSLEQLKDITDLIIIIYEQIEKDNGKELIKYINEEEEREKKDQLTTTGRRIVPKISRWRLDRR
jgi:hypothetical protein